MSRKVSIIVPVYNVSTYINRCLNSIASQTYKDIEVIFVDDCGSDDSIHHVETFISNTEMNCKLIRHEQNKGLSVARNTALEVVSGDYVFFLDSDDEIVHNCIELLMAPIKYHDYDLVVGNYVTIGGTTECKLRLNSGPISCNNTILTNFLCNKWYAMVWNKLYRTKFIRDNNLRFKPGVIHEDELWSFMVSLCAQSMYVNTEVDTYKYHINPGSIMTNLTNTRHYNSWAIIFLEMVEYARRLEKYENDSVFSYIETLKTNITCEAFRNLSHEDFRKYYSILSEVKWDSLQEFMRGRLPLRRFLKDLCFYFPTNVGSLYLRVWYKLTLQPISKEYC